MHNYFDRRHISLGAIVIVLAMLMAFMMLFGSSYLDHEKQYPQIDLDDAWQVSIEGNDAGEQTLSTLHLSGVRTGKVYTMRRILPEEDIRSAALQITVKQAVAQMALDGEPFYSYGEDLYAQGKMLMRGFLIISLPDHWQGKELTVTLTATEPQAFSVLGPVTLGNEQELFFRFLEERRLPMLLGVFMCVYAIFQFLWLPYLFFNNRKMMGGPAYGAAITMTLGLYLLGNYDLLEILTQTTSISTIAEYGALYLIPGMFAAYLGFLQTGKSKRICNICATVNGAMFLAVVILHLINIVHITLFLQVFYIVALVESVLFFVGMRRNLSELQRTRTEELESVNDHIILIGFFVFAVCAFTDVFFYVLNRFFGIGQTTDGIPFMMFGSMCFTITLTAQFFLHGVSHLRADATRGQLEQRAYQDPLTGLANRIKCEQRMTQLKMDTPFVLISLDLDGLKAVNDSIGHAEGDRMLKGFAGALQQCFEGMTLVGRMGGDEFLVILTGTECAVTEAKLKELEHAIFNLNLEEPYFHYSVSYGYASNAETHLGNRVRDIYMLADRRMYDMKRRRKQEKEAENDTRE